MIISTVYALPDGSKVKTMPTDAGLRFVTLTAETRGPKRLVVAVCPWGAFTWVTKAAVRQLAQAMAAMEFGHAGQLGRPMQTVTNVGRRFEYPLSDDGPDDFTESPSLLAAANYVRVSGMLADSVSAWCSSFGKNVTTEFSADDYRAIAANFGRIANTCVEVAGIMDARMSGSSCSSGGADYLPDGTDPLA